MILNVLTALLLALTTWVALVASYYVSISIWTLFDYLLNKKKSYHLLAIMLIFIFIILAMIINYEYGGIYDFKIIKVVIPLDSVLYRLIP